MPKPRTVQTTEVVANPANERRQHRRFSTEQKLRILAEADACKERGEVGALLRKEGIYSSHLHNDRGAPMTSGGFIDLLAQLGVERSVSRPRVSNDNPFSEACFKT